LQAVKELQEESERNDVLQRRLAAAGLAV